MKRLLTAALACGMLIVLAGCDPHIAGLVLPGGSDTAAPTPGSAEHSAEVCIVGDSITWQTLEELQQHAQQRDVGYDLDMTAIVPGYGLRNFDDYYSVRITEKRASTLGGNCMIWVVALGTNDLGDNLTDAGYLAEQSKLADAVGDVPVVWVAPNRNSTKGTAASRQAYAAALTALAAAHSNVHIVWVDQWLTTTDTDPAGVHLTPSGQSKWADHVEDALDDIVPPPAGEQTEPYG
jgi:hypothetical protein